MLSYPRFAGYLQLLALLFCMALPAKPLWAQTASQALSGTLTAYQEPSAYGYDFDLTVTLSLPTSGPAPTGTITFLFNGASVGQSTVSGAATTFSVKQPKYAVGTYSIEADYSGDANYQPLKLTGSHTIRLLHSSLGLEVTTPTYYYGQTLNATTTVGALEMAPGSTTVGGVTSFYVDGNDICDLVVADIPNNCPDNAGKGFQAGTHQLIVKYSGNQYFDASASPTGTFTVLADDTTTAVVSSLNPAVYGQVVALTATVSAKYATPTGTVVFYDGGVVLGTATLDGNGKAVYQSSTLVIGSHPITVVYPATRNFNGSGSGVVTQVITLPPPVSNPTVTLLSSSINPSVFGQNVTFTASVATTGSFVYIPTGTVTFTDGTTTLGTATLDATGTAKLTTSALAVGQHPITASYAASTKFAASTSTQLVQVVVASLTSRGNGFLLTVTPGSVVVGVGASVSMDVNILPLNNFMEPVKLSCANLPNETTCAFDLQTIPITGGTTKLTVSPAAPHPCGSTTPYVSVGGRSAAFSALIASAALLCLRRRKTWKGIALALGLSILPLLGGCGLGNCTDLGLKPGNYSFVVQGTSTGTAAITQTQTVQMTAHI